MKKARISAGLSAYRQIQLTIKIIGLDKNYALERICGSEVLVEYDKLIDRQLERAAITSISGFAKPYQEASKVLSLQ